jgi:hypothetical protein
MPGRKTDLKDAEWLATLMQHSLLQRSFIPERQQRELRELARYRLSLVQERSRFASRLQKVLEDTNIKLAAVATDMQGVLAQAMIRALIQGETDPKVLARTAKRLLKRLDNLGYDISSVKDRVAALPAAEQPALPRQPLPMPA